MLQKEKYSWIIIQYSNNTTTITYETPVLFKNNWNKAGVVFAMLPDEKETSPNPKN